DAPSASAQSVSTNEDTPTAITLSGSDIDSTSLSFIIVSGPSHGTLSSISGASGTTVNNGTGTPGSNWTASVTYTPAANYNGSDSFTYKANDGSLDTKTPTASVPPTPLNAPPLPQPPTQ